MKRYDALTLSQPVSQKVSRCYCRRYCRWFLWVWAFFYCDATARETERPCLQLHLNMYITDSNQQFQYPIMNNAYYGNSTDNNIKCLIQTELCKLHLNFRSFSRNWRRHICLSDKYRIFKLDSIFRWWFVVSKKI